MIIEWLNPIIEWIGVPLIPLLLIIILIVLIVKD